jgi:hypothetical protein
MDRGRGCPLTSLELRTSDRVLVLGEDSRRAGSSTRSRRGFSRRAKTRTRSRRGFSQRAKTRTRRVVLSPHPTALVLS